MKQAEHSQDDSKIPCGRFKPITHSDLAKILRQQDPIYAAQLDQRLVEQEILSSKPPRSGGGQGQNPSEDKSQSMSRLSDQDAEMQAKLAGLTGSYPSSQVFSVDRLVQAQGENTGESDLTLLVRGPAGKDIPVVLDKGRTNPAALKSVTSALMRGEHVRMNIEWDFNFTSDRDKVLASDPRMRRLSTLTFQYSSVRRDTLTDMNRLMEPFKVREDGRILQLGLPYEGEAKLRERTIPGIGSLSPRYVDKRIWREVVYAEKMDEGSMARLAKEAPGGKVDNYYAVKVRESTLFSVDGMPPNPREYEEIIRFKTNQ
jgi:hypothetical protein